MTISTNDVESYLDSNPEWTQDYFIRKMDLTWINKWINAHGYQPITDTIFDRKDSPSQGSSGVPSPSPEFRCTEVGFFSDKEGVRHRRSNSKKYLRNDYAKARTRSMFRTHEPSIDTERANKLSERRNSLKGMRQFYSLPPTSGTMLSMLIQSKVRLPRYESKDEVIKREIREESERDFFLEIVKDISHDLDLKSLASRILVNISILLNAERSSLFFVEGPKGNQMLVSKVFDLCSGTSCYPTTVGDNVMCIPWGEGIIGHVAKSGETVNLTNVHQDPRYKDATDRTIGCTPESLLCMAIYNSDNEVIAVVQTVNKNNGWFTKDDEKILEMYLTFCGLAISNAQAIESYTREYDRNKALLEAVHDLFEEQISVENIVTKIMKRAQCLLKCERCVVILKEQRDNPNGKPEVSRVFDLHGKNRNGELAQNIDMQSYLTQVDKEDHNGFHKKNMLCKRIRDNRCHTLGVAQLINKEHGGYFDEYDDQLFEVFCIFCGLGINNCLLYDEISCLSAKQTLTLDVLSYHATAPLEDVYRIKEKCIPEAKKFKIDSMDFNDFSLSSEDMLLAAIRLFKDSGLLDHFKIEYETLVRWLLTVRKNYRNVAYHNWRHAFNVCQFMFVLLKVCDMRKHLSQVECLALLVACICHDLDHRGTNNAFQQKSWSPLAQLYGTQATLEHHHFNHAVIILNSEGHNIFGNMSSTDYSQVMKLLKHAILATDLSKHVQVRQTFFPLVESGLYNWEDNEQRELLRSIFMTTCDIGTITKPWEIQRKAADLVVTEFFNQGDKEKLLLKIQPIALMDRERQDELPKLQMEWIDGICLPLYKCLAKLDKKFRPMLERVLDNKGHWDLLDRRRLENSMRNEGNFTIQETDL